MHHEVFLSVSVFIKLLSTILLYSMYTNNITRAQLFIPSIVALFLIYSSLYMLYFKLLTDIDRITVCSFILADTVLTSYILYSINNNTLSNDKIQNYLRALIAIESIFILFNHKLMHDKYKFSKLHPNIETLELIGSTLLL